MSSDFILTETRWVVFIFVLYRVYSYKHAKHSLFLYYYLLIIFYTNNCKSTFAPNCIFTITILRMNWVRIVYSNNLFQIPLSLTWSLGVYPLYPVTSKPLSWARLMVLLFRKWSYDSEPWQLVEPHLSFPDHFSMLWSSFFSPSPFNLGTFGNWDHNRCKNAFEITENRSCFSSLWFLHCLAINFVHEYMSHLSIWIIKS